MFQLGDLLDELVAIVRSREFLKRGLPFAKQGERRLNLRTPLLVISPSHGRSSLSVATFGNTPRWHPGRHHMSICGHP
jgi:hypothetical protein